jgi:hypothetical protein
MRALQPSESLTTDLTNCLEECGSERMVDFVMPLEHALPEPTSSRAIICALTIALGYFIGGFVPLLPYFFACNITEALIWFGTNFENSKKAWRGGGVLSIQDFRPRNYPHSRTMWDLVPFCSSGGRGKPFARAINLE